MTENLTTLRAPRWRVLLNTLALCGALSLQLSSVHAATALTLSGTPAASVTAGSTFSFKPTVSGGTGKTVYFGVTNKPAWAGFSTVTGTLSGTPTSANVGTTSGIVIQATNGTQWASTAPFAVKVVFGSSSTHDEHRDSDALRHSRSERHRGQHVHVQAHCQRRQRQDGVLRA